MNISLTLLVVFHFIWEQATMESLMTNSGAMVAQKVHLVPKCITVFTLLSSNSPPSLMQKDKVPIATLSNTQRMLSCVCQALLSLDYLSPRRF